VWDGKLAGSDVNLGIGRGTSPSTEPWVAKVIFEFPYK
jgi:hypothetical protein